MSSTSWPDNTKLKIYIASSREVIERVPRGSLVDGTAGLLDHIEQLIDQQSSAKTRAEVEELVGRVGRLVNESLARMSFITSQLEQWRRSAS